MNKIFNIIFLIPFTFFAQNAPVASHVSAATVINTNATIHLVASDADFDNLTYTIVSSPTNGSLGTVVNSTVTYTPTTNYTGIDSFTFKANDGNSYSTTKTVSIKVVEGHLTAQVQLGDDIDGEVVNDILSRVSFNEDGTIMAVGAKFNDGNGNNSGHVRVYQFSDCSWSQLGGDIDGEAVSDYSGEAISLSSDGTTVAIGANGNDGNGNNSGHVRVYQFSGGSWSQLGDDINGEAAGDHSGISVSLSSDGTTVAIGARYNGGNGSESGHVRVYQFSGGSWSQLGVDIDGEAVEDELGTSVSLSSDGTIVAVGAKNNNGNGSDSGHVRVYQFSGGSWSQLGDDIDGEAAGDELGTSVSLSSDGTIVAVGARYNDGNGNNSGHVRVYQFSGGSWSQLGDDINGEAAGDELGTSVSLSSDGSIVAIGAPSNNANGSLSGHVRVYQFSGGSWSQLGVDIDGEAAADRSGWKVSLSSDGTTVAIGAFANDGNGNNSGHVRVYKLVTFYNVWQGGQSTNWGTATNWSFGSEPSESDNIKIPTGLTATISENEDKVVNSITVDSGGSLILSENSSLSITDSFTNNGTVTLNSDSEKFSSLIVGGSSSGNIVYNRYVNTEGSGEWDLIGSPVDGLSISDFVTTNTTSSPATLATSGSVYAVGVHDNSDDSWTNYTTSTVGAAGNFDIGKGYQMASVNGGTGLLSFTGTVATTDQTQSIINNNGNGSGKRWNLVANPFPSYLNGNSNADGTNNFLTVNAAAIDDNFEALYGWDADGTGYTIYNNSSSATYIAPGQAFFVAAASSSSANLSFTEAMQTTTGGDDFVAGRTTSTSFELVLDMHNDDIKVSDTKFYFKEGLTLGLDPGYDAGAFNQSSGLSSRLVEQDNGVGMGINAMPVDALSNVIVPLTIEQEAGIALKIQIANSTIPEDINVYLEDAMENTFTLLTNESFELLAQTALSGMGRFFIHFTSSTLSTDTAGSTSLLTAYKGKGNAYISVEGLQQFSEPAQLTLYNVLGIKILSKNIQNPLQKEMLSTVGMKTGVYILKVQAENIVFTKKLVIE